eukprot:5733932-Lingulodinium_polyedra.AAC.1
MVNNAYAIPNARETLGLHGNAALHLAPCHAREPDVRGLRTLNVPLRHLDNRAASPLLHLDL